MGSPREKGQGTKRRQLRHTHGALLDTRMGAKLYNYGTGLFLSTQEDVK